MERRVASRLWTQRQDTGREINSKTQLCLLANYRNYTNQAEK